MDAEKAIQAVAFLVQILPSPDIHRVVHVLYFAEKAHLAKYGRTVTNDSYIAMPFGPVPSNLFDLIKSVRGDGDSHYLDKNPDIVRHAKETLKVYDHNLAIIGSIDFDLLSESDKECLLEARKEFGDLPFPVLSKISHDAAWKATAKNKQIALKNIVETLPDAQSILRHLRETCKL